MFMWGKRSFGTKEDIIWDQILMKISFESQWRFGSIRHYLLQIKDTIVLNSGF